MHIRGSNSAERMAQLIEQSNALRQQRDKIFGSSVPLHIIAVSKGQDKEKILPLLEAGHQHFGENRIQEATQKWEPLKKSYPACQLHFVGALQTNKLEQALALFDFIHSLDRPSLAAALKKRQDEGVRLPKLFIQVNLGMEPQKAGVALNEADEFIQHCLNLNLPVIGLMGLPPADHNPAPYFALLKELGHRPRLRDGGRRALPELSMGMSDSLEAAILLGATYIRPGTTIFGVRT